MSFEILLFLALGIVSIAFAVGMLLSTKAVHSALFLIGNFACVAVLYIMLNAPFIGVVQIAVYAGAIMVLFLFVIMLLNADQTTDTTRRFRWLTGVATTLAISFLIALSAPLVIGGVDLPEPKADAPQFRVLHAATVAENPPVTATISGAGLAQPIVVEGVSFGDLTDFVTAPAGTYTVTLTREDGAPIAPPAQVTLVDGQVATVIVYGAVDLEAGTFPSALVVPNDVSPAGDRETRVSLFNGYSEGEIHLVDLGPNRVLDLRDREVLDAEGKPALDASGNPILEETISDKVLVANAAYGVVTAPALYESGEYYLAVVRDNQVIKEVDEYTLERNTEQMVVIVPDAEQPPTLDGIIRPIILRDERLATGVAASYGSPAAIGQVLFTDYLLPVNLVGILLLVGLVGVIVLTRPDGEKAERRLVQRRKVSRPLVNVIANQTGGDVTENAPQLEAEAPTPSGD